MSDAPPYPFDPSLLPRGANAERREKGSLRRIRDMGLTEAAYRGWQEASRWLERVAPIEIPGHPVDLLRTHAPGLADPEAAMRILREIAPQRFFAGVAHPGTRDALLARLPGHPADLVTGALDPGQGGPGGHGRRDWAPARHQWVVRLAQARTVTGDERYAEACARAIDGWLQANPPGAGVNWASNVDVSLRLISWCWALMLLRDSPALSPAWVQALLAAIWAHATHVRRYLSYSGARSTDLTGEALGLFYASTLFPEFRDAERWREAAVHALVVGSEAHVCGDGVHIDRSTCYHRYSVDTYLHFLLLADRNGIDVPKHVHRRVCQMIEFLIAIRHADGTIPGIGDDDGGTLLPLADRPTSDSRGVCAVAAAIFGRGDFAWAADGLAPEVLWLMGPDGMGAFDGIRAAAPGHEASRVFPSGGYAVMRSGWEPDAHQAIVDVGPIGSPSSGGHGHADLLSIQCAIFGEPCLVDAGTYACTGESPWRDFFRSTAVHSTVTIDGISQAEPAGPFGWRGQPRVRLREWHSTPEFDFLDAEHDGYLALPDPVVHRRRVIFVKPGYWILVDDLSGAARHQVDLAFQFGPLDVTLGTHPWARARTPNGRVLWIAPFPSAAAHPSLKCGELAPPLGWIAGEYGERHPAPMLNYSFAVALPWRIVTLLLPDRRGLAVPPAVRGIYDDAGLPTGVAFERPRRVVRFLDRAVSVERE